MLGGVLFHIWCGLGATCGDMVHIPLLSNSSYLVLDGLRLCGGKPIKVFPSGQHRIPETVDGARCHILDLSWNSYPGEATGRFYIRLRDYDRLMENETEDVTVTRVTGMDRDLFKVLRLHRLTGNITLTDEPNYITWAASDMNIDPDFIRWYFTRKQPKNGSDWIDTPASYYVDKKTQTGRWIATLDKKAADLKRYDLASTQMWSGDRVFQENQIMASYGESYFEKLKEVTVPYSTPERLYMAVMFSIVLAIIFYNLTMLCFVARNIAKKKK